MVAEKKKKGKVPHTYVILFAMIILMALLTYVIPAGQYQKIEIETESGKRTVVDPDSFAPAEANPAKPFDVLKAFPKGLAAAQSIVFFIFIFKIHGLLDGYFPRDTVPEIQRIKISGDVFSYIQHIVFLHDDIDVIIFKQHIIRSRLCRYRQKKRGKGKRQRQ